MDGKVNMDKEYLCTWNSEKTAWEKQDGSIIQGNVLINELYTKDGIIYGHYVDLGVDKQK